MFNMRICAENFEDFFKQDILYKVVKIHCSDFIRVLATVAQLSHEALRPPVCPTDCYGTILLYGKKNIMLHVHVFIIQCKNTSRPVP